MIGSYWKSLNLGDPRLANFFEGSALRVEEKVDGSQFSFAKLGGKIHARSKGAVLDLKNPNKLFAPSVRAVLAAADRLPEGVIFRGEAVSARRHNGLTYGRVPKGNVALFNAEDATTGEVAPRWRLAEYAELLEMEAVPVLAEATCLTDNEELRNDLRGWLMRMLDCESFLGGCKVEGVVVKRLDSPIFFLDKPIFAKLVSADFRELQAKTWVKDNPGAGDAVSVLIEELATPQRFRKAEQHMREAGAISGEMRDIGPLIAEVRRDTQEEAKEYVKERLYALLWPKIERGVGRPVPNWYKAQLAGRQFSEAA